MVYHEIVRQLPHRLRVMRMYRTGLKELLNWSASRHHWYPRAAALRQEFEQNKDETDREQIYKLVDTGENLLSRFRHWEPIIKPEVPGGTAYSINPSHSKSLGILLDWDKMDNLKKGDYL
ncbi:hypothetical protein CEUSTIGMA_g11838.t1 [Chlamydomonas eustigma]|uniref:NADH dehydrogenase [ubiquinone] 1 beta subcomplex subunit 9 n=1 Tax=Chlamydomonas eustigma TaxID=1157962 RepID=A0A250XMX3_9CHLO|nr:hypothetical protein CEUSTIGMA_g11838.t1 [Chlamydomonas eustigma]|eukprot:GAX84417.1 hypothetical protein CEUSTIGMA_g11838.t1 [Chlamydomonas eustigma]